MTTDGNGDSDGSIVYLPNAWHCKIFVVPNLIILLLADDVVNLGACNEFSATKKYLFIVD